MQNIDLQIAEFKECSSSGQREKADKLLIDIKKKHPLHPKTSKLISDISSYEPSDDIKDRLSKEFNDGKFIRVINICGSMLSKTPYSIWLLHVIGLAFTKIKKFDEAREAFNRLLFLSPLNERGLTGLGNLFFETNQMRMAAKTFKKTIQHNGDKFEILVDLALALSESKSYLEALDFIEKAAKLEPQSLKSKRVKALILRELKQLDASLDNLNNVIKKDPLDSDALYLKATVLRDLGRLTEAEDCFRKCIFSESTIRIKTKSIYAITSFRQLNLNDDVIAEAFLLLENDKSSETEKSDICFSLYTIYNKSKDYEKAFSYLKQGNDLKKAVSVYSNSTVIKKAESIRQYFTINSQQIEAFQVAKREQPHPTPIFILGMPRSGTTLVENILSQIKNVSSLGELTYLDLATKDNASSMSTKLFFENTYNTYYDLLTENHDIDTPFFVDKMPSNFKFIGVIAKAFPDAKIIHMDRSPQAVCWSQYKTSFGASGQDYSYDLDMIVDYYKMYCDMMSFWTTLYSDNIIHIKYEDMVDAPKTILPPVVERLGFEWKDEYLDYHTKNQVIKTASKDQANKPIYKGSSEEWLNYEAYLDKFKDLKRFYEN